MRAETVTDRVIVHFTVSETDAKDGVKVIPSYRNWRSNTFTYEEGDYKTEVSDWSIASTVNPTQPFDFSDAKVAKNDANLTAEFSVRVGNTELVKGDWNTVISKTGVFESSNEITVVASFKYDKVGADMAGPDGKDDRLQKTYAVHVETDIDSDLYSPAVGYTVNNTDDLAKLVKDGKYTNLPYLYDVDYDSDDNEYVLVYTIDGDDIYANWEEASSVKARVVTKGSTTNDKDTNGDGKVSCDEYYGTTGLVWSDEKNACVVESNGAVVVTIPNTATK